MVRSAGVNVSAPPLPTMTVRMVVVPGVVVVVVPPAPGVVVVVVATAAGWMLPKSPCDPPLEPAVKYSVFIGPAGPPLPNDRAHSPSLLIGLPFAPFIAPRLFQRPFGC